MNPRQQRFVDEYLVDLNGTEAAIRAGYSPRTARSMASRMLTLVDVKKAVEAAQAAIASRVQIDQDAIVTALVQIKDDAMQLNDDGTMKNHGAAIRALELIGKHIGMWPTRVAHSVGGSIGDRLEAAMQIIFETGVDRGAPIHEVIERVE
jgi:phage terminase small subunit